MILKCSLNQNLLKKKEPLEFNNEKSRIIIFNEPSKLFDFAIQNNKLKSYLIDEIKNIIHAMTEILYKPPYRILFGRIKIVKNHNYDKKVVQQNREDIDQNFYDGLGFVDPK